MKNKIEITCHEWDLIWSEYREQVVHDLRTYEDFMDAFAKHSPRKGPGRYWYQLYVDGIREGAFKRDVWF